MSKKQSKTVEDIYKYKNDHEHVLTLPDTYIGSVQEDKHKMWVHDTSNIVHKTIDHVPGMYKIFDEILVNARDNTVRDPTCNCIKVCIDKDKGEISCYNNGKNGIPVVVHKEEKIYVPEMIFGHLRTSSNYDTTGKTVGGKNGFGAKLANIFSTHFVIEVVDAKNKLKYTQLFTNNMYNIDKPEISKLTKKTESSVTIKFIPDFAKFGIDSITDDIFSLFKKRVYDVAACTGDKVKVYFNDEQIEVSTFRDYIDMYYSGEPPSEPVYKQFNDRWKIGVVYDPNSGYRHISYVNGICTYQGGTHVDYIVGQVVNGIQTFISKKHKNMQVKYSHIKDNLTFFIDSVIEDPSFNSQTKEGLTDKVSRFGSTCEIDEEFILKLSKTGVVDEVVTFAKLKALSALKKSDGKKVQKIKGMDKLDDALWAGTRKSHMCRLILTEGDSAKSFAVAGTEIVGKERYGVFPLKGKLLNVRDATSSKLINNEEIKNIKQIMGLRQNKKYTDVSQLRYGGIIILTDQDVDGAHIKGLLINFIMFFWPSLITKVEGFVQSIATPIVKVWKKTDTAKKTLQQFFTLTDYEKWKQEIDSSKWKIKYFKGLGTSTDQEAQESFKDLDSKIITYCDVKTDSTHVTEEDSECSKTDEDTVDKTSVTYDAITLAFSKTRTSDRKKWLSEYNRDSILDTNDRFISIPDFVNKELIHFSNYDNIRSIPSVCDGFKPSQRKTLFGSMKRGIYKDEIKVSQLAAYIADVSAYHHGPTSLEGTIVGMAQNYVGTNNINIMLPNGAFGDRRDGGKSAASSRYINTQLNELVPLIFKKEDEYVYRYCDDDGQQIEPVTYAPLIPLVLVNGSVGIGTGYSTKIPQFNPKDIVKVVRKRLKGEIISNEHITPWYKGFKGKIEFVKSGVYRSSGVYKILNTTQIHITELPIDVWSDDYYKYLDTIVADNPDSPKKGEVLKEYTFGPGNNNIDIKVKFIDGVLQNLLIDDNLDKVLKLSKPINLTNMTIHDQNGALKRYNDVPDIIEEWYMYRLGVYIERKNYMLKLVKNQLDIIEWKVKFIEDVIKGKIVVFKDKKARKKTEVIEKLVELKYPRLSTDVHATNDSKTYSYITNISLFSLTEEELDKLKKEHEEKLAEYEDYCATSVEEIWSRELDDFEKGYDKWFSKQMPVAKKTTVKKTVKKKC